MPTAVPKAEIRAGSGVTDAPGFTARGPVRSADARDTSLLIYRLRPGAAPQRVETGIEADEELAFGYVNAAGKQRLVVFGLDERGELFWYHPAWQQRTSDPEAIRIRGGSAIHELPEAIAHRLEGRWLRIYAAFTDDPITVGQVESLARRLPLPPAPVRLLPVQGTTQHVITLRVWPSS